MAIKYQEAYEFGDLNPVRSASTREYLYDGMPGSGIKAINKSVSDSLQSRAPLTGPYKGIVLRVENSDIKTGNDWDLRMERMRAANIPGGESTTETRENVSPRIRLKVRIPELHAALPVPIELPEFDEVPNSNHGIIDLYPTFIAQTNQIPSPMAGDIVWVDYGNRLTQEDPIYVAPYESRAMIFPGAGAASYGGSTTFSGRTGPQLNDSYNGNVPDLLCGNKPCDEIPNLTNWGSQVLKVAKACMGWGEIYGDDASPFNVMITDMVYRGRQASKEDPDGQLAKIQKKNNWKRDKLEKYIRKDTSAWCAKFISFCFYRAAQRMGVPLYKANRYLKGSGSTRAIGDHARSKNNLIINFYDPFERKFLNHNLALVQPGDIVLYSRGLNDTYHAEKGLENTRKGRARERHIGLVEAYDSQTNILHCIEGNIGGMPDETAGPARRRPRGPKKLTPGWGHLYETGGKSDDWHISYFIRLPELIMATAEPQTVPTDAEIWRGYEDLYALHVAADSTSPRDGKWINSPAWHYTTGLKPRGGKKSGRSEADLASGG